MDKELQRLGFSEKESKVYVCLLELGSSPVSIIAKRAELPRVNCYYTLERLVKEGLASHVERNKIKHYIAEPPQRLISLFQDKLQSAKLILPELLSITNTLGDKPRIRYFEGRHKIQELLSTTAMGKENLVFTNLERFMTSFGKWTEEYTSLLINTHTKQRILTPHTTKSKQYVTSHYKDTSLNLIEVFHIDPTMFPLDIHISIFDQKVMFIAPQEHTAILMEHQQYYTTLKAIFNLAWIGGTSYMSQ